MAERGNSSRGVGYGMVVFIVFLILKLVGVINWSWWWWVTSPLWITAALWLIVVVTFLIIAAVAQRRYR